MTAETILERINQKPFWPLTLEIVGGAWIEVSRAEDIFILYGPRAPNLKTLFRLKENSCEIAALGQMYALSLSPMSKQRLSTELQAREDPDAAEIIKLQNIALFFGDQTLMNAVKCGETSSRQTTEDS